MNYLQDIYVEISKIKDSFVGILSPRELMVLDKYLKVFTNEIICDTNINIDSEKKKNIEMDFSEDELYEMIRLNYSNEFQEFLLRQQRINEYNKNVDLKALDEINNSVMHYYEKKEAISDITREIDMIIEDSSVLRKTILIYDEVLSKKHEQSRR